MEWVQNNLGIVIAVVLAVIGFGLTIFYAGNRKKVSVAAKGEGASAEYVEGDKTSTGDGSPVINIDAKGPVTIGDVSGAKGGGTGEDGKKKDRE